MKEIKNILGSRVKSYRLKQNLSQEKLGELSDLHRTYIGAVERGEKNITVENIYKIAKALNVSLETLFQNISNDSVKQENALEAYQMLIDLPETRQEKALVMLKHYITD